MIGKDWMWENIDKTEIDRPCLALCEALNQLPGIKTHSCCCGHMIREFNICFVADTAQSLAPIVLWVDGHDPGQTRWSVKVNSAGINEISFRLACPPGPSTYAEAARLARLIQEEIHMGRDDWRKKRRAQ